MVELQSCASLMNTSALCAIEQEFMGGNTANDAAFLEILAELQTEKQKNAELRERISTLEAQIQDRNQKECLHSNGQGSCPNDKGFRRFKKQKVGEQSNEKINNGNIAMISNTGCLPMRDSSPENCLVNWMSMDSTQLLHETLNQGDSVACCADTTDDEDNQNEENAQAGHELNEILVADIDKGMTASFAKSSFGGQCNKTYQHMGQESNKDQINMSLVSEHINLLDKVEELEQLDRKEKICNGGCKVQVKSFDYGSISTQKKSQKMAFCPKEVKRIIELEELQLKNAQSHTIRKIIVFASLGIRHGCEDMYELDFNHFSILRKGEPFVSWNDPGEHVLYENPGVRRKVFYPNRQNQTLCPVQILEEEKAMRPFDAGCPSCLFLCIKYGGRTRNLPQNEYVRQRMGRNKLKSFGPVICRMSMLLHIRNGSFFFKALGITLLFMAGFPDDLVQKETKYTNLDLLQKYYRTDEDAEGEDLFLSPAITCDMDAGPNTQQIEGKTTFTKQKAKKFTSSITKSQNAKTARDLRSIPSTSTPPPTQSQVTDYTAIQIHPTIQTTPHGALADIPKITNPMIDCSTSTTFNPNQSFYPILPPYSSTPVVPIMYWPPPNAFPPCPCPSLYSYRPFPAAKDNVFIHPQRPYQPYHNRSPCNLLIPRLVESKGKNHAASAVTDDKDSNSSSSSTQSKEQ